MLSEYSTGVSVRLESILTYHSHQSPPTHTHTASGQTRGSCGQDKKLLSLEKEDLATKLMPLKLY